MKPVLFCVPTSLMLSQPNYRKLKVFFAGNNKTFIEIYLAKQKQTLLQYQRKTTIALGFPHFKLNEKGAIRPSPL